MSRDLVKSLMALGFGLFGLAALGPIYNTYVPLILHDFGINAGWIGFIMTWDNWLNVFVPPWVGLQSDRRYTRWGRRKPWIFLGVILALPYLLIPLAKDLLPLLLLLFVANLGLSIARSPGLALLGDLFPPQVRSTASGVINVFGGLGAVVALVVSRFLFPWGTAVPFMFSGLLLILGAATLLLGIRERSDIHAETLHVQHGLVHEFRSMVKRNRSSLFLLVAIFLSFSGFNAAETWLSSFARLEMGIAGERLPLLMAIFAFTLLLSAIPSGYLAGRWGRKRLVAVGMLALTVLFLLGALVQREGHLYVILALAGIAWSPILVNTLPLMYEVGGEMRIGSLTGFYYLALSVAAILGPQAVGLALEWTSINYRILWFFAATLMLLGTFAIAGVKEVAARPHPPSSPRSPTQGANQ